MKGKNDSSLRPDSSLFAIAALFADNFSIPWLHELSGLQISSIHYLLDRGIREGWLRKKGPDHFSFASSAKKREYENALHPEEKERLHGRMANLLIQELADKETQAQAVAGHLLQVRHPGEKCRWLVRAGDVYLKTFRNDKALECYQKVLDDLGARAGEEEDKLFIETALKYSKVSTGSQATKKVISILKDAIRRAVKREQQKAQALLEMHLAKNEWLQSRYQSALRHFETGRTMATALDDPKLIRSTTTFTTFFLFWQGRFQEAVRVYEKNAPDVEKFHRGQFPLLAALTVGFCYVRIGQTTQGLGMLDAIRTLCCERGDLYMASQIGATIGSAMLDIGQIDDALRYLECARKEACQAHNDWVKIWVRLMLAFGHFLQGDRQQTVASLQEFCRQSSEMGVNVWPYPYLLQLCWAIEQGELPPVSGLSLENEISRLVQGKNIFMKGLAQRYKALLQRRRGAPPGKIVQSLHLSLEFLRESGYQIEMAKTQLELAYQYLLMKNQEKTKELAPAASKILSHFQEAIIPDYLRLFVKNFSPGDDLFREILKLSQEVVTIRDHQDLVHHIISTVNRITKAERGAIFLLDEESYPPRLRIRATKNLTCEQINHPGFSSSMQMMEEVALSGKGRVFGGNQGHTPLSAGTIRSRICVPMILRDKIAGVLYHDNRLFDNPFKEADLELLAYFASQAAFALDNVRAYEEIQRLYQKSKEEKLYFEEQHLQSIHFEDIVGESYPLKGVLNQVNQVAKTDANVLILGETGVGKELVARALHRNSSRGEKSFIRVLCNALPDSLIPSELFGHEPGAFTGAVSRRIGRFELADGGTLFLDEIGDLPLEVQTRLLRVIQSKEFERIGGSETICSDFRLIVATNRNLEQLVKEGKFRSDLYYRLNVFPIFVPPLRERRTDIPLLAYYFLNIYGTKIGKAFQGIPQSEINKLMRYDWPGNVRELENIIERGIILSSPPHFQLPELAAARSPLFQEDHYSLKDIERRHIWETLQKTGWKVRGRGGAAELLELHPSTLEFRMKKLGIQRPSKF